MHACSDALSGAPAFSIDVKKVEGGYQASSPGTAVPPTTAATEGDAIQRHTLALYEALMRGDAWSTEGKAE